MRNIGYFYSALVASAIATGGVNAEEALPPSAFSDMLAYVYHHNPQLNSGREELRIADEKVSQANAGFRPNLNANIAAGKQRQKVEGLNWQDGDVMSKNLTAVQPIFSGFGTLEQKRAALARVEASRARLLSIEQSTLFTAISNWLEICEKERVLILNQDNFHRMDQYVNATRSRFEAGDGTKTDIAQAESRMALAEARYAAALAARDAARATFERNTGIIGQAFEFPPMPEELPASLEETQDKAANNPALAQAQQEERAADHDIEVAESTLWPNIFLRGSMSEERASAFGLDKLRSDAITLNASIPLYQGGGEYSRVREAKLAREKSRYGSIDTSRDVLERARISWYQYRSANKVIDASQRASEAAERACTATF